MKRSKVQKKNALLIIDGHSTRLQRKIWEDLHALDIDVICIPAHTSNITQSLDQVVNAQFKRRLQDVKGFPKKKDMEEKLEDFVSSVCDKIAGSLKVETIRSGLLCIYVYNMINNLSLSLSLSHTHTNTSIQ
jgi:hypothetical protein